MRWWSTDNESIMARRQASMQAAAHHQATPYSLHVSRNIGHSWQKVVAFHWPARPGMQPLSPFLAYRIPPPAPQPPTVHCRPHKARPADRLALSMAARQGNARQGTVRDVSADWDACVAWWRPLMRLLLLLMLANRFSRRWFRIKSPSSSALCARTICHWVALFISLRIPVCLSQT